MSASQQEVAPGVRRDQREGWIPELATDEELRQALEAAFDYRGDVTVTLKDGTTIDGYIFDRRSAGTLDQSVIRLMPRTGGKLTVSYAQIAALAFTGRDTAAGKSWEAWLRKYWEKKAAGEKNIALTPEKLD
jgi:hypothetical protein